MSRYAPLWLSTVLAAALTCLAPASRAAAPAADAPAASTAAAAPEAKPIVATFGEGKYEITFDVGEVPELREWVENKLKPVCVEWYPKIVELLPSDGFTAPAKMRVVFRKDMQGVANTSRGTLITCAGPWFIKNKDGEGVGAVVHELVHVVQQYGRPRPQPQPQPQPQPPAANGEANANANANNNNANNRPARVRNPGWLVEGVADYIRWFLYEPQSRGAEVRNPDRARYDASYRVTANFLNWATNTYDKELVKKLNAAMREGRYSEDLWKQYTGKTAPELAEEWKQSLRK
jgi:hypothetical protein